MALENKKSLLQPSSTQAQQFRLQFSNLAPGGVAATSLSNQQPAPVANARPAVSAFVSAPAPVSLAAPPVIPPAPPTPVPTPAPAPSAVEINWNSQAMYFDGATYLTASAATVGDIALLPSVNRWTSIVGWVKPATDGPWHPKQTILHLSSGSYQSGSVEIYLTGSSMAVELSDAGVVRSGALGFNSGTRVAGNGFGAFRVMIAKNPGEVEAQAYFYSNMVGKYRIIGHPNFNMSGSTDMTIGQNFTGSLDNMTFLNSGWISSMTKTYYQESKNPVELMSTGYGTRVLHYSASTILDITGSNATRVMEFETVTGTLTSTGSYFL